MKKKKFLVILIIAVIIFVIAKIYYLTIIDDVYNAIDEFRRENNRYYSISQMISEGTVRKEEMFVKQEIIKYVKENEIAGVLCEWKNLETNEQYLFNSNNEILDSKELSIWNEGFIKNLPNFISALGKDDKFNIASVMRVRYIIPTKYNNKPCYKVVTKAETIIIDKDTYLPVYSVIRTHNSGEKEKIKIEKTYEFEVGNVTDEDVLLPDLTNYTVVENLE